MPSATPPPASTAVLFREATAPYEGDVIEGEMVPDAHDVTEVYSGTVSRLENALELVTERLADAELAMEDKGWERISFSAKEAFTRAGQRTAAARSREMVVLNPLVRRGVALRIGYIWGNGVQITARADGSSGSGEQDVNAVVQAFLDDDSNREAFSGEQAREESERALATDGNQPWVLFTSPRTGAVQIRALPFDEIEERINNPEDRSEPWFYLRKWTERQTNAFTGAPTMVERKALHPALFYRPRTRPRSYAGVEVRWDAPVYVCSVNRLQGWDFGVGDVYTALPWARAYAVFLTDWAQLIKALSKFAYTKKSDRPRTSSQRAAQAIAAGRRGSSGQAPTGNPGTPTSDAGAMVEMGPGTTLEAVPKTGATIDSESGRPLAAMVAAGLDLPVTMVLGDPGVTGARATAETLDEPTKLSMNARRNRRAEEHRAILRYVILEAVRAPGGPLRGRIFRDDFDREQVLLAGPGEGTDQTIDITWPPLEKADPVQRIAAIVAADGTDHLPGELVTRLLLQALEVDDVDAVMAEMVDDQGNFLDPALAAQVSAGIAAARAFRNGEDPVGAATGRASTASAQAQGGQGGDTSTSAAGTRSGERSERTAREAAGIPARPRMTRRVVERDADGNITALVDVELPQPDADA